MFNELRIIEPTKGKSKLELVLCIDQVQLQWNNLFKQVTLLSSTLINSHFMFSIVYTNFRV